MYGIVEISGHQYKVKEGDTLDVQKINQKEGTEIGLNKVLFVKADKTYMGTPVIKGASILAEVIRHGRSRKQVVFKRKKTSGRRVKNGHRQKYTCLKIKEINL